MTNELAVRYQADDGDEIALNPEKVLRYMIGGHKNIEIPEKEMSKIIMTCKARRLNPFTGDVVITPYKSADGTVTCSLTTTKDFFARRAERNPRYKGKTAGVTVISADGRPVKRKGSAVYPNLGETLVGGWCEVYVEGHDVPEYAEVSLYEYDAQKALWKSKPGTMIRKVAVSQALREAFPDDLNGLYESEEMGLDERELEQQPVYEIEDVTVTDAPMNDVEAVMGYDPQTGEILEMEEF